MWSCGFVRALDYSAFRSSWGGGIASGSILADDGRQCAVATTTLAQSTAVTIPATSASEPSVATIYATATSRSHAYHRRLDSRLRRIPGLCVLFLLSL